MSPSWRWCLDNTDSVMDGAHLVPGEPAQTLGCLPEDARAFLTGFFTWYNTVHRHSGIGLLTPADVHAGRAPEITAARAITLNAAYLAHPERFVRRPPTPPVVPAAVWINPPAKQEVPPQ